MRPALHLRLRSFRSRAIGLRRRLRRLCCGCCIAFIICCRHDEAGAHTDANAGATAAFVGGRDRHGLSHLELRVLAHVADHVHADALVEDLLELVGQREVFDDEGVEREAEVCKGRLHVLDDAIAPISIWLAAMSRKGTLLDAKVSGHAWR